MTAPITPARNAVVQPGPEQPLTAANFQEYLAAAMEPYVTPPSANDARTRANVYSVVHGALMHVMREVGWVPGTDLADFWDITISDDVDTLDVVYIPRALVGREHTVAESDALWTAIDHLSGISAVAPTHFEALVDLARRVMLRKQMEGVSPPPNAMWQETWTGTAEVMYAAYGDHTGNKNFRGDAMPTWDQLPEKIQDAWRCAAEAANEHAAAHVARILS